MLSHFKLRHWVIFGAGLMAALPAAQAEVTVKFLEPGRYADIKGNSGFDDPSILKEIEAHLVAQVGRRLPGVDLSIEVTDVDLAGDVRPTGRRMQMMRVIRAIDAPSMELRYELRESGKVVRSSAARLRDLAFQDRINAYVNGDALRYERRMIDQWLDDEFGRPPALAAK